MKQKLILTMLALVSAVGPALGQPSQIWENWGSVQVPPDVAPQIDALTFWNHAGATFNIAGTALFKTADTLSYTNQGIMTGNPGFNFQTFPTSVGGPRWAANFVNTGNGVNGGVINTAGQLFFSLGAGVQLLLGNLAGTSELIVHATNIVNSGTINMDASSLIQLNGSDVNLNRGTVNMSSTVSTLAFGTNVIPGFLFNAGQLDGYWGVGTANFRYALAGEASRLEE